MIHHLPTPCPGSQCLALMLTFLGRPADARQLQRQFAPAGALDALSFVRAARELGCKARLVNATTKRFSKLPLPFVAVCADGSFAIVAKVEATHALVQHPGAPPSKVALADFAQVFSGKLILLRLAEDRHGPTSEFGLSWFIPALLRYKFLLAEVLGASMVLQLFALASPLFFQVIIDKVLAHGALATLDVLALGLLGIAVFDALLGIVRGYLLTHTTSRVDVELGAGLFKHLLALPVAYFQSRATGQTVARVRELENIRNFLTSSATTVVIDVLFASVFLVVMYLYSPLLTGIVAATFPCYLLLSLVITTPLRKRIEAKFQCGAANQAFLVESVAAISTIKSMAVEQQHRGRWESLLANYTKASFHAATTGLLGTHGVQLVSKVGSVIILWLGAGLVVEGSLSIGQLIAFNMLAGQVSGPVLRLAQLWQDLQQFRISVARLGDVLNTPPERSPSAPLASLPRLQGDVRFSDVTFRYESDSCDVLSNLSIHIKAGEVIGIVGRSGSGKSTLTHLLQRLYTPQHGRVMVDGHDIAHVDVRWLRQQIGVVAQDNVLFSSTVRENIALVHPHAPLERVIAAATLAGAHDFISQLKEGYETRLEEGASNLSGGQRQRIAIARALLAEPKLLIMDEATSALDYESERIVRENMARMCRGRTVIVIAHRLSAVRTADRILVLNAGRIAEQGTHEQLLACGGAYAHLYQQQVA